ncbi:MAG: hypothetical protein JO354_03760 [Verrucomicrobia bacterium]|nr:hypothetical protein [Verrucomicrobiota bacterium]
MSQTAAITPWEPAIAMEAVRMNLRLPVYAAPHATHIYGPLLTASLAALFRLTGLSIPAARFVLSCTGFALSLFLARIFVHPFSIARIVFGVLLFYASCLRADLIFLVVQPDSTALLLASVAIWLFARRNAGWAAVLLVAAMLFKQTAAAFSIIPLVYLALLPRGLQLQAVSRAALLPVCLALTLVALASIWPATFHAIVTVPASIEVRPERAPAIVIYLFATFPVLLPALLALRSSRVPPGERERWALAALIVLLPASIWTLCKAGGSYNSLLPVYLAITALFLARLEAIKTWISSLSATWQGAAAATIAALIVVSFLYQVQRDIALLRLRSGDPHYGAAVAVGRAFHAISPQDPTIAYRATGYVGESLFFQLDTNAVQGNWPRQLPPMLKREIENAPAVIAVRSYVPTPVFEETLLAMGWQPQQNAALNHSYYTLWLSPASAAFR